MRLYISIKFNDEWRRVLTGVAEQCGMPVEEYCKRAIMLTTRQGLDQGLEQHRNAQSEGAKQNAQHTTIDVPEAVSESALPVPDSDSPVLSEA